MTKFSLYKRYVARVIYIALVLLFFIGCGDRKVVPSTPIKVNLSSLYKKAVQAIMESRYVEAVMFFEAFERYTDDLSPKEYAAYLIQRAQAEAMQNMGAEAKYHLHQADSITREYQLDSLRCLMFNAYGILTQNFEADKYSALDYYIQGINLAQKLEYNYMQAVLSANASWLFLLDNDMSGLVYAEWCYKYACDTDNNYVKYCGSLTAAQFYIKQGRIDEAKRMLDVATVSAELSSFADLTELNMAWGDYYAYQNNIKDASRHYEKAVSFDTVAMPDYTFYAYTHWADMLFNAGEYKDALVKIERGLDYVEQNSLQIMRPHAYTTLSRVYRELGMLDSSAIYQNRANVEREALHRGDIGNVKRSIVSRYEREYELFAKEIELKSIKERFWNILFLCIIMVVAIVVMFFSRRRMKKLYKQLVVREIEWNKSRVILEKQLDSYRESSADEKDKSGRNVNSTIESDRALFDKIDSLMRNEKLYKDPYLGRDKLAEILNTNRTYISRAVNSVRGESVSRYIALYRLSAASEILSDVNNNTPIKDIAADLGFTSLSTFYSLFKERYELSPDKFRKYARENGE